MRPLNPTPFLVPFPFLCSDNKIISNDAYNEFMNLRGRFNMILIGREEHKKQREEYLSEVREEGETPRLQKSLE